MLPQHDISFKRVTFNEAEITPLSHSNTAVFLVQRGDEKFILKWFPPNKRDAYQREKLMRDCLEQETALRFPPILETVEKDGHHYALLEHIAGQSLLDRWQASGVVPDDDMRRLGELLADLHRVPLAAAKTFLEPETVLFSEIYKNKMQQIIAPYLPDTAGAIDACYRRIMAAGETLPHTLTHADFGPHQVLVSEGQWVLLDFEFAVIAPFADDLSGTEVRLRRWGFSSDAFLDGYFRVYPRRQQYEAVRRDFIVYNLLAIITYTILNDRAVDRHDLESLHELLTGFAV